VTVSSVDEKVNWVAMSGVDGKVNFGDGERL